MERLPTASPFVSVTDDVCQRMGNEFEKKVPGNIVESATQFVSALNFLKSGVVNLCNDHDSVEAFAELFLKELIEFAVDEKKTEVMLLKRSDRECLLIKDCVENKIWFIRRTYLTKSSFTQIEQKLFCTIDIDMLKETVSYVIRQFENNRLSNINNDAPRLLRNNPVLTKLTAQRLTQNNQAPEPSMNDNRQVQWYAHHNAMVSAHGRELTFPIKGLPDKDTGIFSSDALKINEMKQQLAQLNAFIDKGDLPCWDEGTSNLFVNFFNLTLLAEAKKNSCWPSYWPTQYLSYYLKILKNSECLILKTSTSGERAYSTVPLSITVCFDIVCDFLKNHYEGQEFRFSDENRKMSNRHISEEAQHKNSESLVDLLECNPNLNKISIDDAWINVIENLIQSGSTITEIDICYRYDHQYDNLEKQLRDAVKENTTLKTLTFNGRAHNSIFARYLERNRQLALLPAKAAQFMAIQEPSREQSQDQNWLPREVVQSILTTLYVSVVNVDQKTSEKPVTPT